MSFSSWSSCCISSPARQLSASPQASIILLLTQTHQQQQFKMGPEIWEQNKNALISSASHPIRVSSPRLLPPSCMVCDRAVRGNFFCKQKWARDAEKHDAHLKKCINHTQKFLTTPIPVSGNCILHAKVQSEKYVQRLNIKKVQSRCKCINSCGDAQLCNCAPVAHSLVRPMLARCHD